MGVGSFRSLRHFLFVQAGGRGLVRIIRDFVVVGCNRDVCWFCCLVWFDVSDSRFEVFGVE